MSMGCIQTAEGGAGGFGALNGATRELEEVSSTPLQYLESRTHLAYGQHLILGKSLKNSERNT